MRYINLTSHDITIYPEKAFVGIEQQNPSTWFARSVDTNQVMALFPSEGEARVKVSTDEAPRLPGGIFSVVTTYGEVTGIPDNVKSDDILIVSQKTQTVARLSGHPLASQMVCPYKVVRDSFHGSIVLGCIGLAR